MTMPKFLLSLALGPEAGVKKTKTPLEYWKEVIYECPHFEKKDAHSHIKFSVDKPLLEHWVETGRKMRAEGIEHPVPLDHTTNPEKRRGTVIDQKVALNPKRQRPGQPPVHSLYEKIRFVDEQAAKLARTANASILVDEEMTSGLGTRYKYPIMHTALTDYPVVPGLEPFQAVALSYGAPASPPPAPGAAAPPAQGQSMTLQELAAKMGLNPQLPPDQLLAAIAAAWDALKAKVAAVPPAAPPAGPPRPPGLSGPPEIEGEDEPEDEPEENTVKEEVAKPAPVSMAIVRLAHDNRQMRIEKLALARKITPAVRKDLEKEYLAEKNLRLSLADQDDGFEAVMRVLEKNEPVIKTGSRTGPQTVELSRSTNEGEEPNLGGKNSPLVKNAEKRAAAALK